MRARERTSPREIRFKIERADEIAAEHGLVYSTDKAAFFGVTLSNWSRVVLRDIRPREAFIAAVLGSHPEDPRFTFDTFFEVV